MPYFLAENPLFPNTGQTLKGEEVRHMRLARKIRCGEHVIMQDPNGNRYRCTVTKIKNSLVEFVPVEPVSIPPMPAHRVSLALACIKEKALNFALQKATELGVYRIFLFESEFSQRLPKSLVLSSRLERWHKILVEACKQCNRQFPPELAVCESIEAVRSKAAQIAECREVILHIQETDPFTLSYVPQAHQETLLYVGPEGGFSADDLRRLPETRLNLGRFALKAETAAVASVIAVQCLSCQGAA